MSSRNMHMPSLFPVEERTDSLMYFYDYAEKRSGPLDDTTPDGVLADGTAFWNMTRKTSYDGAWART